MTESVQYPTKAVEEAVQHSTKASEEAVQHPTKTVEEAVQHPTKAVEYDPKKKASEYKVGDQVRVVLDGGVIEYGEVLDKGKTIDGVDYILLTVGNYTKKFVVNDVNGTYVSN